MGKDPHLTCPLVSHCRATVCYMQVCGACKERGLLSYHLVLLDPRRNETWRLEALTLTTQGSNEQLLYWISSLRSCSCFLVPRPHWSHSSLSVTGSLTSGKTMCCYWAERNLENQTKQMFLVYLGFLLAFKTKNILMYDQQVINVDCSSWPQRHLDTT